MTTEAASERERKKSGRERKEKRFRERSATGSGLFRPYRGKIPRCFSMTARLSVTRFLKRCYRACAHRAAFHSTVITLRVPRARRRIKRPPEGKVRSPGNGKYGKMLRCYAERPFARRKKEGERSSFAFVFDRMRRTHDGSGEPNGISISCNEH